MFDTYKDFIGVKGRLTEDFSMCIIVWKWYCFDISAVNDACHSMCGRDFTDIHSEQRQNTASGCKAHLAFCCAIDAETCPIDRWSS